MSAPHFHLLIFPFHRQHLRRHSPRLGRRSTLEARSRSLSHSGKYIRRLRFRFGVSLLPKLGRRGRRRTQVFQLLMLKYVLCHPAVLAFNDDNSQSKWKKTRILDYSVTIPALFLMILNLRFLHWIVRIHPLPLHPSKKPGRSPQRSPRSLLPIIVNDGDL
jgi:hypothetical protein